MSAVLATAALLAMWLGRGLIFRGDDWTWLTSSLHVTPNSILQDYNGHLIALTEGFFWLWPTLFGLKHYWVYRAVAVALHVVVAGLVFLLARRSVGPRWALAAMAVVAFLGTGSDAYLSTVDMGISAAMAASLGALLALSSQTRRADLSASALLATALACFSVAVAFTAGAIVELLLRRAPRRLWIPLVPAALYAAWRIHWGRSLSNGSGGVSGTPLDIIHHGFQAAAGAVAGVAGVQLSSQSLHRHLPWLTTAVQVLVGVLIVAALAWVLRRRVGSPRLGNLVTTGTVLWLLLGAGRGSTGDLYASRYVYQGAIIVVLIVCELAGLRHGERGAAAHGPTGRRAATVLGSLIAVAVALNIVWLIVWAHFLHGGSVSARAELGALQLAGPSSPTALRPSQDYSLGLLTAGRFLTLERRYGTGPGASAAEIRTGPPSARAAADAVLVRAVRLHLEPGRATGSGCRTVVPGVPSTMLSRTSAGLVIESRPGTLLAVLARRFGSTFIDATSAASTGSELLRTPLRSAPEPPWQLQIYAGARSRVCGLRGA